MGWITSPKRASYNHIYNKTTIGIDKVMEQRENQKNNQSSSGIISTIIFIIIMIIIVAILFKNYIQFRKGYTRTVSEKITEIQENDKNEYITEFISKTNKKGFVEAETVKKFKEMMKWCSNETIYNELFSEKLKEEITLEQFEEYKINSFGIDYVSAMVLADDSIRISFVDWVNNEAYSLRVKNKVITEFKKI